MKASGTRAGLALAWVFFLAIPAAAVAQQPQPSDALEGFTETYMHGIRMISPVTRRNFDPLIRILRSEASLRTLSAEEANTVLSKVPAGTFFFAYGFQLDSGADSSDPLMARTRGTQRHHFELHKHTDGEMFLLGLTTARDIEKLAQYDTTWEPSPQLIPTPTESYDILVVVPMSLIDTIAFEDLELGSTEVASVKATLRPMQRQARE